MGGKPKRSQRRKALRLHDCSSANILAGNISRPFYSRLIHSRASFPFKKSVGCVGFFCFRGRRGDREVLFPDRSVICIIIECKGLESRCDQIKTRVRSPRLCFPFFRTKRSEISGSNQKQNGGHRQTLLKNSTPNETL